MRNRICDSNREMSNEHNHQSTLSTQRLEAFSDGVFAIVITLLFINLKVPEVGAAADWRELLNALFGLLPKFLSIFVSFAFVAIFWVAHHQFFHTLRQTTRALLYLNLGFLFLVCFIPFPAAIIAEFPGNKTAVVFFGVTLLLTGIMLFALRRYAWINHQEITNITGKDEVKKALRRSGLIVLFNAVGLVVSFFYPIPAIIIYLLTPLALLYPVEVEVETEEEEGETETHEVVL